MSNEPINLETIQEPIQECPNCGCRLEHIAVEYDEGFYCPSCQDVLYDMWGNVIRELRES